MVLKVNHNKDGLAVSNVLNEIEALCGIGVQHRVLLKTYACRLQLQLGNTMLHFRQEVLRHQMLLPIVASKTDKRLAYFDADYLVELLQPELTHSYIKKSEKLCWTLRQLGARTHQIVALHECLLLSLESAAKACVSDNSEDFLPLLMAIECRLKVNQIYLQDIWVSALKSEISIERKQSRRVASEMENVLRSRDIFLSHVQSYDALTGLIGRKGLIEKLRTDIEVSARTKCTLTLISLRFFNGHTGALSSSHQCEALTDEQVKIISKSLQQSLRNSDSLARVTDDTFSASLVGCSEVQAIAIAERLVLEIESLLPEVKVQTGMALAGPDIFAAAETLLNQTLQHIRLLTAENESLMNHK